MDVSLEDLVALKEALVRGEKEVSINDKRVVYRSVSELREAIREVELRMSRKLRASGRRPAIARQIRLHGGKGF